MRITLSSIQMDATPAPTLERLARAEELIAQAAAAAETGGQVVVLPEVFNTGYEYSPENYRRAERFDGPTLSWLRRLASSLRLYLAGSLLLREGGEIYNAMLLVAPDGRVWRYNKRYPWAWERAYFRPGRGVMVAETALGRLGMLVCWDVGHAHLWAEYAGQVDAMLVSSCPPKVTDLVLVFPNGARRSGTGTSRLFRLVMRGAQHTFGAYLLRQARWLGVPLAISAARGRFSSIPPLARWTSLPYASGLMPWEWRQLDSARLETGYFQETYVADAAGDVLQRVAAEMEGHASAIVEIADHTTRPRQRQPAFGLPPWTYWADRYVSNLMVQVYERGKCSDD